MFSCTTYLIRHFYMDLIDLHYLPDKKLRHSYISGYGPDWLAGIIINYGLDLTKKFGHFFLIKMNKTRLLSCHMFVIIIGLIQLFLNSLHYPQIDSKTLRNLHIEASSMNTMQYSIQFANFGMSELHHGAAFLISSTQQTLVCCTVDKT